MAGRLHVCLAHAGDKYRATVAAVHDDGKEYTLTWDDGDDGRRRQPASNVFLEGEFDMDDDDDDDGASTSLKTLAMNTSREIHVAVGYAFARVRAHG